MARAHETSPTEYRSSATSRRVEWTADAVNVIRKAASVALVREEWRLSGAPLRVRFRPSFRFNCSISSIEMRNFVARQVNVWGSVYWRRHTNGKDRGANTPTTNFAAVYHAKNLHRTSFLVEVIRFKRSIRFLLSTPCNGRWALVFQPEGNFAKDCDTFLQEQSGLVVLSCVLSGDRFSCPCPPMRFREVALTKESINRDH